MARGLDARGTSVRSFARRVAAPLLLFAAALAVRALPYPTVFTAGYGIQPFGNDAYYHLRRIQYAVVNPGEFLSFDRYLNFPHGAQAICSVCQNCNTPVSPSWNNNSKRPLPARVAQSQPC